MPIHYSTTFEREGLVARWVVPVELHQPPAAAMKLPLPPNLLKHQDTLTVPTPPYSSGVPKPYGCPPAASRDI